MARASIAKDTVEINPLHPRFLSQHGFDLKGHSSIAAAIAHQDNRRHHGFILSGSKGVGKATTAYHIAERLFTNSFQGDAPSEDDADVKLIRAASHPDMMVIEADNSKTTAAISVEQIRSIIPFLSHTPARGGWRLVIIDALDEININGANAMLKTLEEPPEKAIILMINHGTRPVLPTIRSRAQMVRFSPLNDADTRGVISRNFPDADPSWVDVAVVLADGAPGMASIISESGIADLYGETCTAFSKGKITPLQIDQLSASWGAGGVKNTSRRVLARLMIDRLLTRAARLAASAPVQKNLPKMVIEEQAISRLAEHHSAHDLAEIHCKTLADLDYAEAVNLDSALVVYQAFEQMNWG
ncbi:MAG: hypothetical protein ACNYPF_04750 [Candidatus Puniceispirillales bacterium WSBS_2018_MAG_OTU23]